jgi:hypothetical protein
VIGGEQAGAVRRAYPLLAVGSGDRPIAPTMARASALLSINRMAASLHAPLLQAKDE